MRRTTRISRVLPAVLLLAACGDAHSGGPVRVGQAAPAYAAETLEGERSALAELAANLL